VTLDEVVPHPQYRMCHSRTVSAPPEAVWDELCQVTMSALPLGYALEGARLLPARLAGRKHRRLAGRTFIGRLLARPGPQRWCSPDGTPRCCTASRPQGSNGSSAG
jgi:hypothetical protein